MSRLPELVTLLTIALLFATMVRCGRARMKYGIKAPATSGHPAFERAYRIQMNTLEQAVMFLPALWMARLASPAWAGLFGLLWLAGRVAYMLVYQRAPDKRGPAFVTALAALVALFIMGLIGIFK